MFIVLYESDEVKLIKTTEVHHCSKNIKIFNKILKSKYYKDCKAVEKNIKTENSNDRIRLGF